MNKHGDYVTTYPVSADGDKLTPLTEGQVPMKAKWITLGVGCFAAAASVVLLTDALDGEGMRSPSLSGVSPQERATISAGSTNSSQTAVSPQAVDVPFSFQAPIHYVRSNESVNKVAIGDVTGDGRQDLVAAAYDLFVYKQQSDGRLGGAMLVSANSSNNSLALGDLNNDTILDIGIGRGRGIDTYTADGSGGFVARDYTITPLRDSFVQIELADVNMDGNADALAIAPISGGRMFYGDGTGAVGIGGGSGTGRGGSRDLTAGDFDGDGLVDAAIVSGVAGGGFEIHSSNGSIMQPRVGAYVPDNRYAPINIAVGDFNGDGRNDYAVTAVDADNAMKLWIYTPDALGRPKPTFAAIDGQVAPRSTIATDLDRDGRTDLVVLHGSGLGYYLRTTGGLEAEQFVPFAGGSVGYVQEVAAGDLNGDGCTDIAIAAGTSGVVVYPGQNCRPVAPLPQKAPHDINLDGKSDLFWRHPARNIWVYWLMNGALRTNGFLNYIHPDWDPIALGHFTPQGSMDLIWTDRSSMEMSQARADSTEVPGAVVRAYPKGYRLVASGDIDGDGSDDLLWRDDNNTVLSAWVMSGVGVVAGKAYHMPSQWRVIGSGDFNGDSHLDLIWTNGQIMRLWSGSANMIFAQDSMGGYPVGWELAGTGDVDGDGRSDLFWRRADVNAFVVWYMSGHRRLDGSSYTVDSTWRVMETGDYNGDHKADLVWTNGSLMQLWQSNGRSFEGLAMQNYPTGWTVIKN
ncbi:FG-GAP repeat domain-containing protein [Lysobacter sp. Hz 25]|uniref:FG-GAP repeat domain-containing protein n=1 Tax=Lysobacter sp. Hz 25 TaxID=3383698 RepID=UPI0038D36279